MVNKHVAIIAPHGRPAVVSLVKSPFLAHLFVAMLALCGLSRPAYASDTAAPYDLRCLYAAEDAHGINRPLLLLAIFAHEKGVIGHVNVNRNRSVDIGPMQINSWWLPRLAAHWHTTVPAAFRAIRDHWCVNVTAAALILGLAIDQAGGDTWLGVARYHSPTPAIGLPYARAVAITYAHLAHQAALASPK